MRVGIFSESYEPIINGVSVCVSTLRDELARRGHDVFIFAPAFKGYQDQGNSVFRLPSMHTVFMPDYPFPIPISSSTRNLFASLKLDIVHTQTPFLLGILGARWARKYGIPLVSTNHTLYTEYAHYVPMRPKSLTRQSLISLMRWYYSGCDAVVVPSNPVAERLRSYGIKTRVEVIKTGVVSVPPLKPEDYSRIRQDHGVEEKGFLFLYVGRIAREKNLQMLLKAFKQVSDRYLNTRLLLIGGGPALAETKNYALGLGLQDKLEFLGMMPRKEIEPYYAAADAFVFPSTTETQGIAICEALSAGLPVVAVNAGGIPENIQPGVDGFLTSDDSQAFAEKMMFLIEHERERKEMGTQARINACHFSIDRMVSDFERFYISVIEGKIPAASHVAEIG